MKMSTCSDSLRHDGISGLVRRKYHKQYGAPRLPSGLVVDVTREIHGAGVLGSRHLADRLGSVSTLIAHCYRSCAPPMILTFAACNVSLFYNSTGHALPSQKFDFHRVG